ncbi:MAG: hypothetical protein QXF13_05015 [Thermoproteota archaeon]
MVNEFVTSAGVTVKVRAVPVWYIICAADQVPMPEPPYEEIVTAAGVVERKPARPGTPEYEAYARKLQEAAAERERRQLIAAVDAAVVAWKVGDEWVREPPDDWQLPEPFATTSGTGNRRVDYILHELLLTPEDLERVTSLSRPVSDQQIQEARRLF